MALEDEATALFAKIKVNNALIKGLRDAGTLGTNAQPSQEMIKVWYVQVRSMKGFSRA